MANAWLKDVKRIVWHNYQASDDSPIVLHPATPIKIVALEKDGYLSDETGVPDSDVYFLVLFRLSKRARGYNGLITKTADHWAQVVTSGKKNGTIRNRVIVNAGIDLTTADREKIRQAIDAFASGLET